MYFKCFTMFFKVLLFSRLRFSVSCVAQIVFCPNHIIDLNIRISSHIELNLRSGSISVSL